MFIQKKVPLTLLFFFVSRSLQLERTALSSFDFNILATEQLTLNESILIEHIVIFNDCESFLIPIATTIDRPFIQTFFDIGAKYRLYFYLIPEGLDDIDNTRIELVGPTRQVVNFVLTESSRKK